MSGFSEAVQTAIYQKLTSNAALMAEIKGAYDRVPEGNQDNDFPFVVVGDDSGSSFDTDTEIMMTFSANIHTWSRYGGRAECKKIQGLIYDTLHRQNLSFTGFDFVNINQETVQSFLDNDGRTTHGVQTFNLIIERT